MPDDDTLGLDHVQPDIFGGTDDLQNLRPTHAYCKRQRGEWDVGSYYAWALTTGREALVPELLRASLLPEAAERALAARLHYSRATRGTDLPPLGGRWAPA